MVGVVGAKSECLTGIRYVYDLHRKEKRDIFERRLSGEQIDEKGHSTLPEHLQEDEE